MPTSIYINRRYRPIQSSAYHLAFYLIFIFIHSIFPLLAFAEQINAENNSYFYLSCTSGFYLPHYKLGTIDLSRLDAAEAMKDPDNSLSDKEFIPDTTIRSKNSIHSLDLMYGTKRVEQIDNINNDSNQKDHLLRSKSAFSIISKTDSTPSLLYDSYRYNSDDHINSVKNSDIQYIEMHIKKIIPTIALTFGRNWQYFGIEASCMRYNIAANAFNNDLRNTLIHTTIKNVKKEILKARRNMMEKSIHNANDELLQSATLYNLRINRFTFLFNAYLSLTLPNTSLSIFIGGGAGASFSKLQSHTALDMISNASGKFHQSIFTNQVYNLLAGLRIKSGKLFIAELRHYYIFDEGIPTSKMFSRKRQNIKIKAKNLDTSRGRGASIIGMSIGMKF